MEAVEDIQEFVQDVQEFRINQLLSKLEEIRAEAPWVAPVTMVSITHHHPSVLKHRSFSFICLRIMK